MKGMLSEVVEVAKLSSSSSFSSAMSSGMASEILSVESRDSVEGESSERNRRRDSGEMSLDRLPSEGVTLRRPSSEGVVDRASRGLRRSLSLRDEELAFRLKSFLGERDQPELGERDRADLL